jgi:hypothetical protein
VVFQQTHLRTPELGNSANILTATVQNFIFYPQIPKKWYKVVCCDIVAVHMVIFMSVKLLQMHGFFAE